MQQFEFPTELTPEMNEVGRMIAERLRGRTIVEQVAWPRVAYQRSRLLSAIVLLASRCGSHTPERTSHPAAAIALINTALDMHGDLVDSAARRREAVDGWPGMDGNVALMVGDYLLTLAAAEMAKDPDSRIISYYSRAVMSYTEAALAPVRELLPPIASEQALALIQRSIGTLFEAAAKAGGVCGNLTANQIETLGQFGSTFGIALQLASDANDYRHGTGQALRSGLITFPLIYAAAAGGSQVPSPDEGPIREESRIAAILAEVAQLAAADRVHSEALAYAEQAQQILASLPASTGREELIGLVQQLR
jgi:geranylgeranyl pyrophosphate synthase